MTSNPTDESIKGKTTKRKKSSRTIEGSKELKKEIKPLSRREFIPIASK